MFTHLGIGRVGDDKAGNGPDIQLLADSQRPGGDAFAGTGADHRHAEDLAGAVGDDLDVAVSRMLHGDANGDGKVDINDLTIILANYGQTGVTWSQGDFNGDGKADINDLTIVLANFGLGTGSSADGLAAVPEPSALVLVGLGVVSLVGCTCRRRK